MIYMRHDKKLKIIQKISGLTQERLADKIGVSFATINSWINNKSTPRKSHLDDIDNLYYEYTGQKRPPESDLQAKKDIVQKKSATVNVLEKIVDNPDLYDSFIVKLTYNSNSIEGNTLTEPETAAVIFDNAKIKDKNLIEMIEAKNHRAALDFMFSFIKDGKKIDEDFILDVHNKIMNSIRSDAGIYRNIPVRIAGSNVPTANPLSVPDKMKEIVKKINKTNKDIFDHVTNIHAEFEQIHPFSDGNGRVGRILMNSMLLKKNLPPAIIDQNEKHIYYKALNRSQIKSDTAHLEDLIVDSTIEGLKLLLRDSDL